MSYDVRFYRSNEKPYGCFSNLFRRSMFFEGREFPTAEHAYQYGKARKPEVAEWLMDAPSPSLLAGAAHSMLYFDISPGWSKGRRDRMYRVVASKFAQHPDLMEILRSTGTARIVEAGTVDNEVNRRWGEVNGVGQNWLGLILMEVRADAAGKDGEPEASITIRCVKCSHATTVNGLDPAGIRYRAKFLLLGWRKLSGKWACPACATKERMCGR